MSEHRVPDDETLYRRIPPQSPWLEPPDRITSANFRLRKGRDRGLSVYRASKLSVRAVLEKPDAIPGSLVVAATAREIRALTDGNGKPLHLDVVVVDDENDPGHAEIRGPVPGSLSDSASLALKRLFRHLS